MTNPLLNKLLKWTGKAETRLTKVEKDLKGIQVPDITPLEQRLAQVEGKEVDLSPYATRDELKRISRHPTSEGVVKETIVKGPDTPGINWRDDVNGGWWSPATVYKVGDAVYNDGSSWRCVKEHRNLEPSWNDDTYWKLIARVGHGTRGGRGLQGEGYEITNAVASESLAAGDFVNLWNDGGVAKARKADASSTNQYRATHFVKLAYSSGETAKLYKLGANDKLSGLTIATRYFLSTTVPGSVQATRPTGDCELLQPLGEAVTATSMSVLIRRPIILAA